MCVSSLQPLFHINPIISSLSTTSLLAVSLDDSGQVANGDLDGEVDDSEEDSDEDVPARHACYESKGTTSLRQVSKRSDV